MGLSGLLGAQLTTLTSVSEGGGGGVVGVGGGLG